MTSISYLSARASISGVTSRTSPTRSSTRTRATRLARSRRRFLSRGRHGRHSSAVAPIARAVLATFSTCFSTGRHYPSPTCYGGAAMPQSMTGFGSGRATQGGEDISVELKSVNHKFCEVKTRIPRELAAIEPVVVKQIKARLSRGAIDLTVKRGSRTTTGQVPVVDVVLV